MPDDRDRARATPAPHRTGDERGVTVVEWALLAAALVVAASIIAAVVLRVVDAQQSGSLDCAGTPTAVDCGP